MKNLFFWAQSLDNQSPDLIFQDREEIVNESICQKIVSEIYNLPGEKIKLSSEVTVRFSDPKFVIEAIPLEKDEGNRLAPIVIYGQLPDKLSPDWIESSCSKIREVVAHQLKRTLNRDAVAIIKQWFNSILEAKKNKVEEQKRILSVSLGSLTPLLVGWILQSNGILQLNTLESATLIGLNNLWLMLLLIFLSGKKISTR